MKDNRIRMNLNLEVRKDMARCFKDNGVIKLKRNIGCNTIDMLVYTTFPNDELAKIFSNRRVGNKWVMGKQKGILYLGTIKTALEQVLKEFGEGISFVIYIERALEVLKMDKGHERGALLQRHNAFNKRPYMDRLSKQRGPLGKDKVNIIRLAQHTIEGLEWRKQYGSAEGSYSKFFKEEGENEQE